MPTPLLSIVVLAYNHFHRTTEPCLNSLRPWIGHEDFEFIVFDNASPDGSTEKTRQWCKEHPEVIFIASPENLGYAGGMNKAASFATGKWILLVNNDTEFPQYALDAMKRAINLAPSSVAMLGPITNAAGNGQRLYAPDRSKQDWMEIGTHIHSNPNGIYLPTYRCDFFCVAIRFDAWQQLNGLDTIFGRGYYEDFDFSMRLRESGFEYAITEDVFVFHQGSATFSSNPDLHALIKKNKKLMKKRYPNLKLFHARECNLQILKEYKNIEKHLSSNQHKLIIRDLRVAAAQLDQPKSILKRILWHWKISKYI